MCAQSQPRCQMCGTAHTGDAFCANCGTRLGYVCADCGEIGLVSAQACRNCGRPLPVPAPGPSTIRRGLTAPTAKPTNPAATWASITPLTPSGPPQSEPPRQAVPLEFTRPSESIDAGSARPRREGSAVIHALGAVLAMLCGSIALILCSIWVNRSDADQVVLVSVVVLVVNLAVWLGTTIWMGRHAGGGMALLAFFLAIVAWPVYVFRQKRGLISRSTGGPAPPYPAYSIAAILVVVSLVLGGIVQFLPQSTNSVTVAQVPGTTVAGNTTETQTPSATDAATLQPTASATKTTAGDSTDTSPSKTKSSEARQQDANAAAKVVVDISRLEMLGEFNAVYDLIHPDARAVVPRGAAVGWYRNEIGPRGPRLAKVVSVRFVTWKWKVTGKTYKNTAIVTFQQHFRDGSVDESVMRLVKHDGEWRWFFGTSKQFVNEQIAKYVVTDDIDGTDLAAIPYDVDAFWRQTFEAAGLSYDSAEYFQFDNRVRTACGRAGAEEIPAFYCPGDAIVYTARWFQDAVVSEVGDYAWVVVVAHEFGHHVEAELKIWHGEVYSIQLELEADCLAGVYTQDAESRGLIEPGDIDAAMALMAVIGDPDGVSVYDPSAHGTAEERAEAFLNGYNDGLSGCGYTT